MHQSAVEANLLGRLFADACRNGTSSGQRCAGSFGEWDLCPTHAQKLAAEALREVLRGQLAHRLDAQPIIREPMSHDEAIQRLAEILAARTSVPGADASYTIPIENLTFAGRDAQGPSIVAGDEPVRFRFFERAADGRIVARYGIEGSLGGRDMPFVSEQLFSEVMHCLRHLNSYTETCEATGDTIHQPLGVIAHKLLRGAIDLERVHLHFVRVSPRAKQERAREAFDGEQIGRLRSLRVSPLDLARGMRATGLGRKSLRKALRSMWLETQLSDEEVEAVLDVADAPARPNDAFIGGSHGE